MLVMLVGPPRSLWHSRGQAGNGRYTAGAGDSPVSMFGAVCRRPGGRAADIARLRSGKLNGIGAWVCGFAGEQAHEQDIGI